MECNYISENCRACQMTIQEKIPVSIFTGLKLPDIFKEVTSLDIQENDGLPKVLCCSCYNRLLEAYNFRKMCYAAVLHFQKILSMLPEEKYTPSETTDAHLTDFTSINVKTEPDSNGPGFSPNREDSQSEISDKLSIDEKPLILNRDPDDGTSFKDAHIKRTDIDVPGNMICSICDSRFQRKSRLEMHIRKKHLRLKPYECKICGKGFKTSRRLKIHIEMKRCKQNNPSLPYYQEDTENYMCTALGSEKSTADELKSHMDTHKKDNSDRQVKEIHQGVKDYYCLECKKSFANARNLKNHIMRHGGIKNHECTVCGVRKATRYELKVHMITHTKESMWSCEFCPYKSNIRENLQQHVKTVHHGIKDYHCSICKKSFTTSRSLKHHLMLHTGEKPYACSHCEKKFITNGQLRIHMKVHTGEHFACELCPYKTIYRPLLTRHMKTVHHKRKVKKFHCPYCKKSYKSSKGFKVHVMVHTEEKSHACVQCEKKFITRTALKSHMKSHGNSGSGSNLKIKEKLTLYQSENQKTGKRKNNE